MMMTGLEKRLLPEPEYFPSDGGRKASGRNGYGGDCVVRAAALLQGWRDGLPFDDFRTAAWGRLYDRTYRTLASAIPTSAGTIETDGIDCEDYQPVFVDDFGFTEPEVFPPSLREAAAYGPCIVRMMGHCCFIAGDGTYYDLADVRLQDVYPDLLPVTNLFFPGTQR